MQAECGAPGKTKKIRKTCFKKPSLGTAGVPKGRAFKGVDVGGSLYLGKGRGEEEEASGKKQRVKKCVHSRSFHHRPTLNADK